ncbi:MAG: IPT/TIG domain-containing protein, partial [Bacillota bacterium]|nr:IPT/TIG domain-containing protein [Bacillota bacterium]
MKFWNKLVSLLLVILLCGQVAFAVPVGPPGPGGAPDVTHLKYALNHDENFSLVGGYLELLGSGLKQIEVYFELSGKGFVEAGNRITDTGTFVKINLSVADSALFTGRVRVGNKLIDLKTSNFPNFQGSDRQTVVKGKGQSIRFTGNYLNQLNQGAGGVVGTYGAGSQQASLGTTTNAFQLILTDPVNPGRLGYQTVTLRRQTQQTASEPSIEVEYLYRNVFRIIEDLAAGDIEMFPNTGSRGDEIYFRSDTLSDTRSYVVYFLKSLTDRPSDANRLQTVDLSLNIQGNEDRLTVRIPENSALQPQTYYVLITDVQNGQIVAEQLVKRPDGSGEPDQFVVIQADNRPRIESVYPAKGPDTGSDVEIKANYILSLKIPDLIANGELAVQPTGEDADQTLILQYKNGSYKGETVKIRRKINVVIGEKARFIKNPSGAFQMQQSTPDQIMVRTRPVSDAETDPIKDVIIEMETELTVVGGSNDGKRYVFRQVVVKKKGYEFEPSTYTPKIDSVTPQLVQIEDTAGGYSKMKEETLISIKGDRFLVDRFVDPNGNVITRMPSVLIKKNDNNTFNTQYQLGFFPNREYVHNGVTYRGLIYYKDAEDASTEQLLTDSTGRPIPLDMVVLTKDGVEVDGVSGNQIGQNIIIRIPADAKIRDGGVKHVQVTNPVRKSSNYGRSSILSDVLELVKTGDVPVIEYVVPNIITADGGDEIIITGANIADGVKLFLDGNEISNFTRELDPSGNRILVKFKAPKGREGTTQLMLQNPSGGTAVADFTYVRSFHKNPVFHRFTPPSGTEGTLVLIDGDNFLKPDPTAITERGVDAYRLIGTRVFIDGRDVNTYKKDSTGRILFSPYVVPSAMVAIREVAGKAVFSPSAANSVATATVGGSEVVAVLGPDA